MRERVLLVKFDKPAGGRERLSFSEPIGLCYLSAVLKEHGIECCILHMINDFSNEHLVRIVAEYRPTIVGFSVRNFNFDASCDAIREIRDCYRDIRVVIGGECITLNNSVSLAHRTDADLAVVSDGEQALLAYAQGISPSNIPGVVYRTEMNEYQPADKQTHRVDPATLPMMDRTHLPMEKYSAEAFPGKRYATLHAQRGCRYRCTFCHTACRYQGPISRTVDQILNEIDFLTLHHGVQAIAIWDEDFFSDPQRVRGIAQGLVDRGSPIAWHTYMKLTDIKNSAVRQLLPLLQESRYERSVIGLESFIPETLRRYHKTGGPNVEESLQLLTDHGIGVCPAYIIGEPHETYDLIKYGLDRLLMIRESGILVELPYISFLTPFPGTAIYEEYENCGLILDHNWIHYDGGHVVVKCKCPPDRLVQLRDRFYKEFYGES